MNTGHEVWMDKGQLVDAMRASYALPGIFSPVNVNGRWLFDGAMVNPVPVSVCRAFGADIVIAVNLNSDVFGKGTIVPSHEAKEIDSEQNDQEPPVSKSHLGKLRTQIFGSGNGAPGLSSVMLDAFNITQDRIARARLAGDPPDISIVPRVSNIGLFDFHRAEDLIEAGKEATLRAIEDLEHHLSHAA